MELVSARALRKQAFRCILEEIKNSLRKLKALDYTCGLGATIVGLGLYSYYVRELLASLFLFSAIFFSTALVVLILFLAWSASKQVALWSRPASRNAIALALAGGTALAAICARQRS
jgi:hypothetical protein